MGFFDVSVENVSKKVQTGEISAKSIIEKSLTVIAEKNKYINAFITVCDDYARQTAKNIDDLSLEEKRKLPLCGIPIAVKDNISTKGIRTTCGSKMLENYIPPYDAHVVEELKKAGAIIVGKANMDEFAMGSSNETSYFGTVKNPHDLQRVPGGSSGGSAAAVAADMVPLALGSDTGGSIRQPASYCGIVGLKPAYGMVSRYGLIAFASSLDQIGPMANSIEDAEYLLRVIASADKRDSTNCQKSYTGVETKNIKDAIVGIPKEYLSDDLPKDVRTLFEEKVKFLKDAGIKFVDISLENMKYAIAVYYIIATAEASSNLSRFDGVRFGYRSSNSKTIDDMFKFTREEGFGEEVKRRIMLGTYVLSSGYYDAYYIKAAQVRSLIAQDFKNAFVKCNVILSPVTPSSAFKIGEIGDPLQMYLNDIYTVSANLAGCSGLALPMGKINGLPIGIQLMAPNFKMEFSYAIAKELEKFN
ncbi:MAG: Asp-tRNA(Asn)/Glu-tRNA(Gln) amidotransferase subunit GatA [Chitinispirillales bacterium]|jgi:aspartyl-tRNA(Asn)/glutamyl-tRNA(Gln) amidotransferase subunit A|nr:Asp-tRNA(Asn)/Glu-tRNA(Gln) amidotransferase subunit GatA [Chitinispirillales bacterium]